MPELIDIRDQDGNVTGETTFRQQAHQDERWHGVALVWVLDPRGRILLQRRPAHLNAFPERWDVSLSGHIAAGEEPRHAAARELLEEIGVYVKPDELTPAGQLQDSFPLAYGKTHHEVDFIFMAIQDVSIDELKLQAAEVSEVRWARADELERDLADKLQSSHYAGRSRQVFQIAIDAARKLNPAYA
jgi:isopentenyl-diphosphate Delta-isomerase